MQLSSHSRAKLRIRSCLLLVQIGIGATTQRQPKVEPSTFPDAVTLLPNFAVVKLDQSLHERQSKAQAVAARDRVAILKIAVSHFAPRR